MKLPLCFFPQIYKSSVPGHEGECVFTWRNSSYIDNRLSGGTTGFFRNVIKIAPNVYWMTGREFHGMILFGTATAFSTEECYCDSDYTAKAKELGIIN